MEADAEARARRLRNEAEKSRSKKCIAIFDKFEADAARRFGDVLNSEAFWGRYGRLLDDMQDAMRKNNPKRTQAMANALLDRMKGFTMKAAEARQNEQMAMRDKYAQPPTGVDDESMTEQEENDAVRSAVEETRSEMDAIARQNALNDEEVAGTSTETGTTDYGVESDAEAAQRKAEQDAYASRKTNIEIQRDEAIRNGDYKNVPIFSEEDAALRRKMKYKGRLLEWRKASSIKNFAKRYGDGDILLTYFSDGLMYPPTPNSEGYDAYRILVNGPDGAKNRRRLLRKHNPTGEKGGLDVVAMDAAEVFGRPEYAEVGGAEKLMNDYLDQFAEYDDWVRRGAPSVDEEMNDMAEIGYWNELLEEQRRTLEELPELERAYADIDGLYSNAEAVIGIVDEDTGAVDRYVPISSDEFHRIQNGNTLQWNGMDLYVANVLEDGSLLVYNNASGDAEQYILIAKNGVGERNERKDGRYGTPDGAGEGSSSGRGNTKAASESGVLRSPGGWEARRVSGERGAKAGRNGAESEGGVGGRKAPALSLESVTQEQLSAEARAREEKAAAERRAERDAAERERRLNVGAKDAQDLDADELPLGTDTAGDLFSHAAQRRTAERAGDAAKFSTVTPEDDAAYMDAVKRPDANERTTLLAPNGKRSNLSNAQYHLVRTQRFKDWFGDWEALAEFSNLRNATSVSNAASAIRAAGVIGKDIFNRHLGITGRISSNSLSKMESETATKKSVSPRLHALAVANADRLFAAARLEYSHPDSHGRKEVKNVRRLGSVMLDQQAWIYVPVMLTVKEYKEDGNQIYTVEAVDVGRYKENDAGQLVAVADGERQTPIASFVESIAKLASSVNPSSVSKVVDENGEPKVVYHGTNKKFFEFSPEKMGTGASAKNKNRQSFFGPGFYFAEDYNSARDYGRNVIATFLNIRNPAYSDLSKKSGNDGIRGPAGFTGRIWVADVSSQAKLSDAVTYDDAGNVIPLSKRFDQKSNDIRFSLATPFDYDVLTTVHAASNEAAERASRDIRARISRSPVTSDAMREFLDSREKAMDRFRRKIQDMNLPIKRLEEHCRTKDGKPITEKESVYYAEDRRFGIDTFRTDQFMDGTVGPIFERMNELGVSQDDLDTFLKANYAAERNAMIAKRTDGENTSGSGMTNERANELLDGFRSSGAFDSLSEVADMVYAMNREVLENRVAAGLMSRAQADAYLEPKIGSWLQEIAI